MDNFGAPATKHCSNNALRVMSVAIRIPISPGVTRPLPIVNRANLDRGHTANFKFSNFSKIKWRFFFHSITVASHEWAHELGYLKSKVMLGWDGHFTKRLRIPIWTFDVTLVTASSISILVTGRAGFPITGHTTTKAW